MVIDKNSCLCGASILVPRAGWRWGGKKEGGEWETKEVKGFELVPLGRDLGGERSGVWLFAHVLLQSVTDPGGEAK